MSDNFTGRWLVTEYVYNPDGTFAGIVHQKRYVERQSDTHLRVIQDCQPSSELESHVMGQFAGHWEFDLHINAHQREYHGIDVVGTGNPYGKNTMLGQGIWTRFGYNFTSFGVLPSPERQLTGGAFYNVNQMVARIIGVASPEKQDAIEKFPTLNLEPSIFECSNQWQGQIERYDTRGICLFKKETLIQYDKHGNINSPELTLKLNAPHATIMGTAQIDEQQIEVYGKQQQYGCLIDEILYSSDGMVIQSKSLLDVSQNTLVIIRQIQKVNQETLVDILTLKAT